MNNELWTFTLSVFASFFAIMNPIANMPIFIGMTSDADEASKKRVAKLSTIYAFLIVATFVFIGKYIFQFFGITIPAFKITGGILVFYIGFEMLQSKKSSIKHQARVYFDEGIAISPLAIPILAGPGTIVTAMNYTTKANYIQLAIILIVFALITLLTYFAFRSSDYLIKLIGQNKIVVINKLMGLIISIVGTDMVLAGIKLAFA